MNVYHVNGITIKTTAYVTRIEYRSEERELLSDWVVNVSEQCIKNSNVQRHVKAYLTVHSLEFFFHMLILQKILCFYRDYIHEYIPLFLSWVQSIPFGLLVFRMDIGLALGLAIGFTIHRWWRRRHDNKKRKVQHS